MICVIFTRKQWFNVWNSSVLHKEEETHCIVASG